MTLRSFLIDIIRYEIWVVDTKGQLDGCLQCESFPVA